MLLYRDDLDSEGCEEPGCHASADGEAPEDEGIYLHARCHAAKATWVRYHRGVIHVVCSVCRTEVCRIAVARRRNDRGPPVPTVP